MPYRPKDYPAPPKKNRDTGKWVGTCPECPGRTWESTSKSRVTNAVWLHGAAEHGWTNTR